MTTSRRDVEVVPGFTFSPQHKDLTDLYLRGKIAGESLPAGTGRFIHDADVYSAEPEQLARAFQKAPATGKGHGVHKQPVWYFFSAVRHPGGRKKKARGDPTRKPRTIDGVVGKHWHSEHRAKPVEGGSAVGGCVQDFSYMVKDSESGKNVRAGWIMYDYGISEEHGGGDLVLCKILPSDPAINSKRKRKAAACGHPEDTTASTRPRRTVDHDGHPPPGENLGAATTTESQHHQMEEGTQPEPEEPSADEIIYGLPCPSFSLSPEMIRICSMMPWPPSPTSMAAILSGL